MANDRLGKLILLTISFYFLVFALYFFFKVATSRSGSSLESGIFIMLFILPVVSVSGTLFFFLLPKMKKKPSHILKKTSMISTIIFALLGAVVVVWFLGNMHFFI